MSLINSDTEASLALEDGPQHRIEVLERHNHDLCAEIDRLKRVMKDAVDDFINDHPRWLAGLLKETRYV